MFEEQLQPFIEWKKLKGYNVVEAYTDNIGSTKSEIKSYLEDLHNNPDPTAPSFVLFVGDVGQIPAWSCDEDSHVSDLYYCDYTNDSLPDVYYGRFSAQDTSELQPQIDKTFEYEKYEMTDPSYLGETLLVAGHDDTYQDPYGNGAMWYADNYYYNEVNGINSSLFLQPADNEAVHDYIIKNMNNGLAYANYTAHCSSEGWADPVFSLSDLDNLTNEGKYALWVGNCCLSVKSMTMKHLARLLCVQKRKEPLATSAEDSTSKPRPGSRCESQGNNVNLVPHKDKKRRNPMSH